jgi:hypothetical protein
MVALFLTTIISCKQAFGLIQRIQINPLLNETAKTELIEMLRETIPSCPVTIKKDGK